MLFIQTQNISRMQVVGHQKERHVSDDLTRRRHLNNVPKKLVYLRIHFFRLAPALPQSHGCRLFPKIGILPARNLVLIQTRGARLRSRIERPVKAAHGLPIIRALIQRFNVELCIARCVSQRFDDGIQIRLTCASTHRGNRGIGHVHSSFSSLQNTCGIEPACVMRVKVHRYANLLSQHFH